MSLKEIKIVKTQKTIFHGMINQKNKSNSKLAIYLALNNVLLVFEFIEKQVGSSNRRATWAARRPIASSVRKASNSVHEIQIVKDAFLNEQIDTDYAKAYDYGYGQAIDEMWNGRVAFHRQRRRWNVFLYIVLASSAIETGRTTLLWDKT